MSVDSSPDLDKILYRSMSVDSSPDKISTCDSIFRKNGYVKSQLEKIFEFEIFVLKFVLDHSESIPTKKFLQPKFFVLAIFSTTDPIFRKNDHVKS